MKTQDCLPTCTYLAARVHSWQSFESFWAWWHWTGGSDAATVSKWDKTSAQTRYKVDCNVSALQPLSWNLTTITPNSTIHTVWRETFREENFYKFQSFVAIRKSFLHDNLGAWCLLVEPVSNPRKFLCENHIFHQFMKVSYYMFYTTHSSEHTPFVKNRKLVLC